MGLVRLEVSKSVLSWAIDRSGIDLSHKFPKLDDWLSGNVQPTLRQLEEFSKMAAVPFGYLFLTDPPIERPPIPHFRTLREHEDEPLSPDLLDTIYMMQRRQAWMREYLVDTGHEPLQFVRSESVNSDKYIVSKRMREVLGIDGNWAARQRTWTEALRALRQKTEEAGVLVAVNGIVGNNTHRKLNVSEFRGFVLVDEYAPLVFINGADGKAAQMFTLAHELAHIWLGHSAAFDLRALQPAGDAREQICNIIAAEFLVPEKELLLFWARVKHNNTRYQDVARQFKVSELVAARRALDANLINRQEFFAFYENYQQLKNTHHATEKGGDFYATQSLRLGKRLGEAVVRATREGRLSYDEAYRLTGLYGRTFENYAANAFEGTR
jgi:Zn-dependent peptidase ImmA (M78 family)